MIETNSDRPDATRERRLARAPEFTLPGTTGGDWTIHRLHDYTNEGVTVVGFFGHDALEEARPLSWLHVDEAIDVLVVSDVECSALSRRARDAHFGFPLLGDPDRRVATEYGAAPGEDGGRRVFIVDSSDYIRGRWDGTPDATAVYDAATRLMDSDATIPTRGAD